MVEWKKLESNLNIEPYEFPEQGIERYESAVRSNESIKRDLTLRNEKLGQVVHTLENVKVMSERDEKRSIVLDKENLILKRNIKN